MNYSQNYKTIQARMWKEYTYLKLFLKIQTKIEAIYYSYTISIKSANPIMSMWWMVSTHSSKTSQYTTNNLQLPNLKTMQEALFLGT